MTTVTGSKGRKYEVRTKQYGMSNTTYMLYYGGIFLAGSDVLVPKGQSCSTLEVTIERANERADALGIEISE